MAYHAPIPLPCTCHFFLVLTTFSLYSNQFQDSHGRRLQNKVLFDGIPSAPPCAYSAEEINQAADQIPTFVANGAPCPDSSYCSSTTDEPNPNRSIPAATTVHDTTTNRIHDRSLRSVSEMNQ